MGTRSNPSELLEDLEERDPEVFHRRKKGRTRQQREHQRARRAQAVSLRLAGMTYEQIGERLEVSASKAQGLVSRALQRAERGPVEEMRELENQRLDRAQAAIWPRVLRGEDKAVSLYLQISDRRAKLNGLNEPTRIDLSMSVKHEMVQALEELETMVLGEIESTPVNEESADGRTIESGAGSREREEIVDAELVDD